MYPFYIFLGLVVMSGLLIMCAASDAAERQQEIERLWEEIW